MFSVKSHSSNKAAHLMAHHALYFLQCCANMEMFVSTVNVLPHPTLTAPFRACCRWRVCCVRRRQEERLIFYSSAGGPVRVTAAPAAAVTRGTAVNPVQPPAAQRQRMAVWERSIHTERARFLLHCTPPKDTHQTPHPSATRPLKVSTLHFHCSFFKLH